MYYWLLLEHFKHVGSNKLFVQLQRTIIVCYWVTPWTLHRIIGLACSLEKYMLYYGNGGICVIKLKNTISSSKWCYKIKEQLKLTMAYCVVISFLISIIFVKVFWLYHKTLIVKVTLHLGTFVTWTTPGHMLYLRTRTPTDQGG